MKEEIHRTHYANQVNESLIGTNIRIAGWIEDIRDIGNLGFIILRDVTGTIQVVVNKKDIFLLNDIPRQSSIVIDGLVQKSRAKNFSVEIHLKKVETVAKAIHPLPIDPTGRVESASDKRLDARSLDLRNPSVAAIFHLRSIGLDTIRETLKSKKFIEINSPKIIGTASEGGANLFECQYFNRKAYLAQSPQLYKEQLTLGLDRIYEIAQYYRAENSNTIRHLTEFLSVDIEAAYMDYEDIMEIIETVVKNVIRVVINSPYFFQCNMSDQKRKEMTEINFDNPFKRIRYQDCIDELKQSGEQKEDEDDLTDLDLRKIGKNHQEFFFITDWPLKLKPFYIHEKEENKHLSESFDLQYGFLELVSGGRRQHDPEKLKKRLEEQGLNPIKFAEHLKSFNWGMPPHSGCGLGFDRLMMVLTGSENIRDVVLYPRDPDRLNP